MNGSPRTRKPGVRARGEAIAGPSITIVKAFGPLRLEQLTPLRVQRWLNDHKTAHGARRRITLAHATLRSALSEAQRLQYRHQRRGAGQGAEADDAHDAPLTMEQATVFLTAADTHRLGALFSVALACGLRLGEATGLRWEDVNLETGELRVRQQLQVVNKKLIAQPLKTEKSRRTLVLPTVCLEAIKAHRTKQLEERLKSGPRWVDTGLVFTTFRLCKEGKGQHLKVGAGLHPRNVLRTLYALLDAAKLPRVRFHDLRHSAASLLIAAGVELVEVSMLLGHSELRVTADLYSHLQQQTAARAAQHMDAILKRQCGD